MTVWGFYSVLRDKFSPETSLYTCCSSFIVVFMATRKKCLVVGAVPSKSSSSGF